VEQLLLDELQLELPGRT